MFPHQVKTIADRDDFCLSGNTRQFWGGLTNSALKKVFARNWSPAMTGCRILPVPILFRQPFLSLYGITETPNLDLPLVIKLAKPEMYAQNERNAGCLWQGCRVPARAGERCAWPRACLLAGERAPHCRHIGHYIAVSISSTLTNGGLRSFSRHI